MTIKKNSALSKILKDSKEFKKVVPLELDEGIVLKRSTSIGKNKINELLKDLVLSIKFTKENNIAYLTNNLEVLQYLNFLIVKHFTDLEESLEGQDFYVNFDTYQAMYNKGYLDKALLEIGENNINKVEKAFNVFAKNLVEFNAGTEEILNEIEALANGEESESIPKS